MCSQYSLYVLLVSRFCASSLSLTYAVKERWRGRRFLKRITRKLVRRFIVFLSKFKDLFSDKVRFTTLCAEFINFLCNKNYFWCFLQKKIKIIFGGCRVALLLTCTACHAILNLSSY